MGRQPGTETFTDKNGMLNAVGLQGEGVAHFIEHDLVALEKTGATIIVSIWGHSVQDYLDAAKLLGEVRSKITALEINLSCPNLGATMLCSPTTHNSVHK